MSDALRIAVLLVLAVGLGALVGSLRGKAKESRPYRLRRQYGQWYITDTRYGIVGCGATIAEAHRDVDGLVAAYLASCRADGMSDAEARATRQTTHP
jgi:hypothetical protein